MSENIIYNTIKFLLVENKINKINFSGLSFDSLSNVQYIYIVDKPRMFNQTRVEYMSYSRLDNLLFEKVSRSFTNNSKLTPLKINSVIVEHKYNTKVLDITSDNTINFGHTFRPTGFFPRYVELDL
jgi:hypothetical protein